MGTQEQGGAVGPIRSMTGFGRGRRAENEIEVVAEVRSVNHRFFDVSIRLPRLYSALEPHLRKVVGDRVHRGKIDVTITRTGGAGSLVDMTLDRELAEGYFRCLLELKEKFGLTGELTVSDMLTARDIIVPTEREEGIEKELPLVENALHQALDALDTMREAEGAATWKDIESRLKSIHETVALIPPLVHQVVDATKERLEKRVQELTGGIELDQDRLAQEVALMADRADVSEEINRLGSHTDQFLSFGQVGSPIGRKLDFLLQELHREVNTIGSKSASTDIAFHVVNMKADVEKIREQTQNLE